jgi:aerobic carbon-monoxide dehydrogenase medium subunit
MKPVAFDYQGPGDLGAAIGLLGEEGAKLLAGGQSLGPMLNLRLVQPSLLIDLAGIAELRACEHYGDGVRLGAMITHAAIEDGRVPDASGGILPSIAAGIAYRAIRNRGTIGGALAHADPAADWLPALIALGATAVIAGAAGERRVAVADFVKGAFETVLGETEILTAVDVPAVSARAGWGWVKLCRKPGEFAQAIAAVLRDPARGISRAVIGATHGAPIVLEEASEAAGSEPLSAFDPVEQRLYRAALRRALDQAGLREP